MRFSLGVAFKALADRFTQVIQCSPNEQRKRGAAVPLAAQGAPPAADALAKCSQSIEDHVAHVAIGREIGATLLGNGVALLSTFGR